MTAVRSEEVLCRRKAYAYKKRVLKNVIAKCALVPIRKNGTNLKKPIWLDAACLPSKAVIKCLQKIGRSTCSLIVIFFICVEAAAC